MCGRADKMLSIEEKCLVEENNALQGRKTAPQSSNVRAYTHDKRSIVHPGHHMNEYPGHSAAKR